MKSKSKKHSKTTPALPATQKSWLTKISSPRFGKYYVVLSIVILLATTFLWAWLGASLNQINADQLVDGYLFQNWDTLHNATFPGPHTFLVKWPLFLIVKLFGYSNFAFVALTTAAVLLTVAALAFIIYKINSRPLIFGSLMLALALVLLMVPAQPYAGGLLPVNMAMLTTRNLEYIVYIGSLVMLIRAANFKSRWFWLSLGCLSLLIASDKLFLTLGLGGGVLALITYALARNKSWLRLQCMWIVASLVALVLSASLLWLLNYVGLTHIASIFNGTQYQAAGSLKDLLLGVLYAGLNTLTNFGANPAFDATIAGNVLGQAKMRLLSPAGLPFVINLLVFALGLYATFKLFVNSLVPAKKVKLDNPTKLSVMLTFSGVTAVGAFVLSGHYYAVDARYLTIILFAVFIAAATWLRKAKLPKPKTVIWLGGVLVAGLLVGVVWVVNIYNTQKAAYANIAHRDSLVVDSIKGHGVDVLVGDYWRVLPIKQASQKPVNVMPLSSCTTPRDILSSRVWQPDLTKHSFAYLLSLDASLTDYPHCSLDQITNTYGKPNASVLIAGSLESPQEVLLFYDHGIHKSAPTSKSSQTVLPIGADQLPKNSCSDTQVIMNIVAHQDDDLLFINPDLANDIKAKHCVRTVYVTAGDSGQNKLYWLARERGSEAAYSGIIGEDRIWIQRIVKLGDNQFVTVANPRGNQQVSLIFIRLPDGNINGHGFASSGYESLERLLSGRVKTIHSVDNQSFYSQDQLVSTLTKLMQNYKPTQIRTQATYNAGHTYADHSDHIAVGRLAKQAYQNYQGDPAATIKYYIGYPIREMPQNVFDPDLTDKTNAFIKYGQSDGAVCQTAQQCQNTPTYGSYLKRQYSGDR